MVRPCFSKVRSLVNKTRRNEKVQRDESILMVVFERKDWFLDWAETLSISEISFVVVGPNVNHMTCLSLVLQ